MPECNRLVFRAGEELIEAAKRNDFCKVLVPGSGFFPLAAPAGPGEWGLWLGQELLGRDAVICHDLALWGVEAKHKERQSHHHSWHKRL